MTMTRFSGADMDCHYCQSHCKLGNEARLATNYIQPLYHVTASYGVCAQVPSQCSPLPPFRVISSTLPDTHNHGRRISHRFYSTSR